MTSLRIAVDAMGGDYAPVEVVRGAVRAARRDDIDVVLVGDEVQIKPLLQDMPSSSRVSIVHTDEWYKMDDPPTSWRGKRRASSIVAAQLVKSGEVQGMVSAGNTGALIQGSVLTLGCLTGMRRPALSILLPTLEQPALMLDLGANVDCKPEFLLQFALMGSAYMSLVLHRSSPRVGILNIGEEATKGNQLVKDAYRLLEESGLNFVGSVEPKQLINGYVDVAVCDGFVGNLMLKMGEAMGELIKKSVKSRIGWNPVYLGAAAALTPVLASLKKDLDHSEYGGAPLLGLRGVVIKSHGRARALAIRNAVKVAARVAAADTVSKIESQLKAAGFSRKPQASPDQPAAQPVTESGEP